MCEAGVIIRHESLIEHVPSTEPVKKRAKKWTEEKRLRLMHSFRLKPALWDPQHPMHYKRTAKCNMWNKISAEVKMPQKQCKEKIVNLMSGFRREKAKLLNLLGKYGGVWNDEIQHKLKYGWEPFKELAFLMYKIAERQRQESGQPIDRAIELENMKQALLATGTAKAKIQLDDYQDDEEEYEFPGSIVKVTQSDGKGTEPELKPTWDIKPESPDSCNDLAIDESYLHDYESQDDVTPGPSTSNTEPAALEHKPSQNTHDEIQHFANFIASKMKKYSEITKNAVQKEICDIIFKADQDYLP